MSQTNNISLKVENLTIGYKHGKSVQEVLSDISLEATYGQLVCFMGPNGVGKSTLIRTLCGLQQPIGGNIALGGQALEKITQQELAKKISLVLTDRINAGNLSAYELVALGRYPYLGWRVKINDEDQRKIDEAIDQTNISSYVNKKTYELSDGQLQKVMIARAYAQDTPLMILDEPTAHLDLNNRVEVVNLLRDLTRNTDKTIIMATHELDLALQSADTIWLAGFNSPIKTGFPEDLVLNGDIDRVFELKGYDLKTGTLKKTSLGYKVNLKGQGHYYLWTKNALERNGFDIDPEAENTIFIHSNSEPLKWSINQEGATFDTLRQLIYQLIQLY